MNETSSFSRNFKAWGGENRRTLGVFGILVTLTLVTGLASENFFGAENMGNQFERTGRFGIIAIGVAFVIFTGGIDLSIGSLIGLCGVMLPMLVSETDPLLGTPLSMGMASLLLLAMCAVIGLIHGVLITKFRLQPFVVTLCGLLIYRGMARVVASDSRQGFGNEHEAFKDAVSDDRYLGFIPAPFFILLIIAVIAWILLNRTVFGRQLIALGRNEEAAAFSGVPTARIKVSAYVISSFLAGVAAILFVCDQNGAAPAGFGNFFELWAIAGAVLGGCSLRGGEGSIVGVILGSALLRITLSASLFLKVADYYQYIIVGGLLLLGVVSDEILARLNKKHGRRT
ncbi:MAG: ABC transporter permease [Verrucomicrobiota bacterium]